MVKFKNIQNKYIIEFLKYRLALAIPQKIKENGMDNTVKHYCTALENFELFLTTKLNIKDVENFNPLVLSRQDFAMYSHFLINVKNNSANTHNHRFVVLKSFLQYLLDADTTALSAEEEIKINKVLKSFRKLKKTVVKKEKKYFTPLEIKKIHKYILESNMQNKSRNLAIFLVYRDTADRRNEVLNINLTDLHLDYNNIENSYIITRWVNKTLQEKKHFLKADTVYALQNYLSTRNPKDSTEQALFLSNRRTAMKTGAIYAVLKKIYIDAGFYYIDVETSEKKTDYTVHSLRHSTLTVIANVDGIQKAKEHAGHSTITTTQLYVHANDSDRKEITRSIYNYNV